jgi:hypothetical protein
VTWLLVLLAVFTVLGLARRETTRGMHVGAVAFTVAVVGYQAVKLHII